MDNGLTNNSSLPDADDLVQLALEAMKQAYVPYSGFHVGAALVAEDGSIHTGCNVENASYGGTICAERTAIVKMVSGGHRRIKAIAITSDSPAPTMPCGICRQVLAEFADMDVPVHCASRDGRVQTLLLRELLPHAFTPEDLKLGET